jgi:serine/tyrosine/threonine adenylyltransferase
LEGAIITEFEGGFLWNQHAPLTVGGWHADFSLQSREEGDLELAHALLRAMYENAADFTLTFRRLCDAAADEKADTKVRALFANPATYDS